MQTNPSTGRKRARLFGNDPIPGFVFSLDTSKKKLPSDFFKSTCTQMKATVASGGERCRALSSGNEGEKPSPISHSVSAEIDSCGLLAPRDPPTAPAREAVEAVTPPNTPAQAPAVGVPTAGVEANGNFSVEFRVAGDTQPAAAEAVVSPVNCPGTRQHGQQSPDILGAHANTAITVAPAACAEHSEPAPPSDASATTAVGPRRRETHADAGVANDTTPAAVTTDPPKNLNAQRTPRSDDAGPDVNPKAAAASMVASFLKRGSTLPPAATAQPSPAARPHAISPPKTPTPLASIVAGVPPGSGGSSSAERRRTGDRAPSAGDQSRVSGSHSRLHSPRRGSNRFLHEDWPPILKKRRRILYYNPRSSAPAGSRIVYWIRGNLRVKDNQALSVAMWLSTELRLPLQAVTFVDPLIGMSSTLRPAASGSATRTSLSSGRVDAQRGTHQRQELPFRMAVEASGLCEMEEALQAFNVPLVAIACAEGEIPSTLGRWCSGRDFEGAEPRDGSAAAWTPPAKGAQTAAAAGAAAAAPGSTSVAAQALPTEGSVRVVIMDESYHPRQLSLSKKVKDALRGTAALYAVDSSSVYAVNTGGGGNKIMSPEEFRRAQEECLPIVLDELTPRPRLPLEPQLQKHMLAGDDKRAMLPHAFEHSATRLHKSSAVVIVNWGELRAMSARRFPEFGRPMSRQFTSSTKDLIPILGGGERVGKAALEQTLDIVASSTPNSLRRTGAAGTGIGSDVAGSHDLRSQSPQEPPAQWENGASLEREAAGLGFEGCLLHLLRLGSLSSLSVVQALFHGVQTSTRLDQGGGEAREMCDSRRKILEAVLSREYALYRSHLYHRGVDRSSPSAALAASSPGGPSSAAAVQGGEWRGQDHWMGFIPAWVWEELTRGQRDARQHLHSPGEIRLAGSKAPSSVDDEVFSAIQDRLANGGRLYPSLAPYWARAVVKMMLSPPQAVSLLVGLAEEFSLGAAHAGDIVPDLLDCAFGILRQPPPAPSECAGASPGQASEGRRREIPVFRRLPHPPLASKEGLRSAFGGRDAVARFLSPFVARAVPTLPLAANPP
ncbi:unnamed protein product [Scytosiphon promiscuus]